MPTKEEIYAFYKAQSEAWTRAIEGATVKSVDFSDGGTFHQITFTNGVTIEVSGYDWDTEVSGVKDLPERPTR